MVISSVMNSINTMNNSASRMMNASNALLSLASFSGNFNNLSTVNQTEKLLLSDKFNSELMYKMSYAQVEALKKLEKENIKRSFSTFA